MIGMGISEFSTPAPFIPRTKAFLKKLSMERARQAARDVLEMDSAAEIRQYLKDLVTRINSHP
jgi:phosphotransferase system enzyme I (PtsP)